MLIIMVTNQAPPALPLKHEGMQVPKQAMQPPPLCNTTYNSYDTLRTFPPDATPGHHITEMYFTTRDCTDLLNTNQFAIANCG